MPQFCIYVHMCIRKMCIYKCVYSLAGIIPANGEVDISVVFSPTSFQTATAKLQLTISQYLSEPLVCTVLGQSAPGLSRLFYHLHC